MKIHNCEQRSDEWHKLRLGKVTASHFKEVLSDGVGRKDYMERLVDERITGNCQKSFESAPMRWGTETEPAARKFFEETTGWKVAEMGFVEVSGNCGVSPDGFTGNKGIIEIKCPNSSTHKKWTKANVLPPQHKAQVQGLLWACEREWCDFVSFDPRVPTHPIWTLRVERDEPYIELLAEAIEKFVKETAELEAKVRAGQAHLSSVQQESMDYNADMEDEWQKAKDERIRGMCRHGIVCAMTQEAGIEKVTQSVKDAINEWVEFIMTGK